MLLHLVHTQFMLALKGSLFYFLLPCDNLLIFIGDIKGFGEIFDSCENIQIQFNRILSIKSIFWITTRRLWHLILLNMTIQSWITDLKIAHFRNTFELSTHLRYLANFWRGRSIFDLNKQILGHFLQTILMTLIYLIQTKSLQFEVSKLKSVRRWCAQWLLLTAYRARIKRRIRLTHRSQLVSLLLLPNNLLHLLIRIDRICGDQSSPPNLIE